MKRGAIVEVRIDDYAFGGKGIARLEMDEQSYPMFVKNALPGQKVMARVKKKRKKYAEGNLIKVLERSDNEIDSPYQLISGAPYIKLPIELQKRYKKESTCEVFRKLGNIKDAREKMELFIPAPEPFHYRNKMEYSFSAIGHDIYTDEEFDGFALGFKRRGTWWKVENLDRSSGLFDEAFESQLHLIRKHCENTGLPAWHPPQKKGFFRHLVVRKSFAKDQIMVNLVTSSEGYKSFDEQAFLKLLKEILGDRLAGFTQVINDDVGDRTKLENSSSRLIYGTDIITEQLSGLKFDISMESFFQTNPQCAALLYDQAIEYALEEHESENSITMDLFCGTGTIGQLVAAKDAQNKVIGVDIVEAAISNAKHNAQQNQLQNIQFYAEDVGKFLKAHPEYEGQIDTIIIDPPRAGIAPKTLQKVIKLGASRIVYISCNPSTQARDAQELTNAGYELQKFSLVDQFPHTAHIESIAQFNLKETK